MSAADAPSDVPHRALAASTQTPIAQLGPHLTDITRRSVRGVITIVWPYSIITKSLSFQLAEPDFRLRRQKGQVRVTLAGACAKAVADASIEGGDEILLCLDGVEWVENDAPGRIPGATLEWQAKFASKALLQITSDQWPTPKTISVHGADDEPKGADPPAIARAIAFSEMAVDDTPARTPSPPPETVRPSKRPLSRDLDADEYASPAFIKRARMSYGSLFEGGLNIFDEEDAPRGRRRRRTTFGRSNNGWRYASQSRSPEPDQESVGSERREDSEELVPQPAVTGSKEMPQMADEGCQTSVVDLPSSPSPATKKPLGDSNQPSAEASEEPTVDQAQELATTEYDKLVTGEHADVSDIQHPPVQREPTAENPIPLAPNNPDTLSVQAPMYPGHYAFNPMGHQVLPEPGMHVIQAGFSDQGVLWDHAAPYPPLQTDHQVQPSPFLVHTPTQYPEFPDSFTAPIADEAAPSIMHPPMQAFSDPEADRDRIGSNDTEPYVIDSDAESVAGHAEDGEGEPGRGEAAAAFVDNTETLARGPGGSSVDARADTGEEQDETDASESGRLADEGAEVAFETDDEEPGGDYDTRKYSKPQDDDDGSLGSDVDEEEDEEMEVDEDELQAGIHDESGEEYDERLGYDQDGYEDEEGYDAEGYDEEGYGEESGSDQEGLDDENDSEEEGGPPPPATFKPSPAPVFIDLISDSEDEDQEPAPSKPVTQAMPSSPPINRHDVAAGKGDAGREGAEEEGPASDVGSRSVSPSAVTSSPQRPADFLVDAAAEKKLELAKEDLPSLEPEPQSKPDYEKEQEKEEKEQEKEPVEDRGVRDEPPPSMTKTLIAHGELDDDAQISSEAPAIDDTQLAAPVPETVDAKAQPALGELRDADEHMDDGGPQASPLAPNDTERVEDAKAQPSPRELGDADVDMADAETQHSPQAQEDASNKDVAAALPSPRAQEAAERMDTEHMGTESMGQSEARPSPQAKGDAGKPIKDAQAEAQEDAEDSDDAEVRAASPPAREDIEHMDERTISKLIEQQLQGEQSDQDEESIAEEQITVADDEAVKSEAQLPEQDVGQALASPPLTQDTKIPDLQEPELIKGSQETPGKDQLPTPHDTQLDQTMEDASAVSDDAVESVTITRASAKTLQPSPSQKKAESVGTSEAPSRRSKRRPVPVDTEPPPPRATEGTEESPKSASPLVSDAFTITLKSLRNRQQHSSTSSERRAITASQDPSTRLARASLAARRASEVNPPEPTQVTEASPSRRKKATEATPPKHRATRSRTRSVQRSTSPELPLSPRGKSVAVSTKGAHPGVKQLSTSLRTTVPNLTALRSLRGHVNKTVDAMGVVTMQPANPQRPKHGPRDYLLSFSVTDQSAAPTHVVAVQVFRPHRESLPVVQEGDVILLREFAVAGMRGRDFGLRSGEASSWAVFERGRDDGLPQIRGPPAEVSKEEGAHGELLLQWYEALDDKARQKLGKANERMEEAGQG